MRHGREVRRDPQFGGQLWGLVGIQREQRDQVGAAFPENPESALRETRWIPQAVVAGEMLAGRVLAQLRHDPRTLGLLLHSER